METLTWLQPRPGGVYVDATLGGGGHAEAILDRIVPGGRLIGIDRDEQALEQASRRLERFGGAVTLIRENFAAIRAVLLSPGIDRGDGGLFGLGGSPMPFADPRRRCSGRRVDSAPLPSTPWRIEPSNTPSCASPVGAPVLPGPPPARMGGSDGCAS